MSLFTVAIVILSAWYISRPLWSGEAAEMESDQLLLQERERLILELRELDLDFGVGKVTESDYEKFKAGLSEKLLTVLSSLKEHSSK